MEYEVIKDTVIGFIQLYVYAEYQGVIGGEQEAAEKIAKYIQSLLKTK